MSPKKLRKMLKSSTSNAPLNIHSSITPQQKFTSRASCRHGNIPKSLTKHQYKLQVNTISARQFSWKFHRKKLKLMENAIKICQLFFHSVVRTEKDFSNLSSEPKKKGKRKNSRDFCIISIF